MVILDTNVISEALKPRPDANVLAWLAAQSAREMYITTITKAEILSGVELLPSGRAKIALRAGVTQAFDKFADRVLALDDDAALAFPGIRAARAKKGRPIGELDGLIAAIARSRGFAVATRDTRGFEYCGVALINPWLDPSAE